MPGLIYADAAGNAREKPIAGPVIIGSSSHVEGPGSLDLLTLPPDDYLETLHALITRQETTKMPILVDLVGHDVRVNGAPILGIKVLRHNDRIHLGRRQMNFWEIRIVRLDAQSSYVNYECPLCKVALRPGDEAIICPHSPSALHRRCWFVTPLCPVGTCEYPNHAVVMDTLSATGPASTSSSLSQGKPAPIRFERDLAESADPVVKKLVCSAQRPIDQVPFKSGQNIAYCPDCEAPYHLQCWLDLPMCLKCGYNIQARLDAAFKGLVMVSA